MPVARHGTLTANTVATVTLDGTGRAQAGVEVYNRGAVDIFAVVGSNSVPANPTVGGNDTYVIPGGDTAVLPAAAKSTVSVKLISSGTPPYSVTLGRSNRADRTFATVTVQS